MKLVGVCLTHARPIQLANAIACFERQDYPDRFLIVLDDGNTVTPARGDRWEILSTPYKFASLGDKRRAAVEIAIQLGAEGLVVHDDDDVYLRHHYSAIAAALARGDVAVPSVVLSDYQEPRPGMAHLQASGRHHGAWGFTPEIYRRAGGYQSGINSGEDKALMKALKLVGAEIVDPVEFFPPSYWYRWTHSGAPHVSASGWAVCNVDAMECQVAPVEQLDWNALAAPLIGDPAKWREVDRQKEDARDRMVRAVAASAKPRVGLLSPSFTVGGVERWFESLVRKCQAVTFSGVVAVPCSEALIDRKLVETMREIVPVEVGSEHVGALLDRTDILIVWGNDDALPWLAGWKGKVVFVSHGQSDWTRLRAAMYADRADALFAVSRAAVAPFPESHRGRVKVIRNGVDRDWLHTADSRDVIRERWGLEPGQVAVGYVGRFSPEKNPEAVARAVASLPGSVAVYQVPAPSRGHGRDAVSNLLSDNRVRWLDGPVGDVYRGADVFMMPSHQEGFCLAIVEAWTSGIPVVATNVGAIAEMEGQFGPMTIRIQADAGGAALADAVQQAMAPENRETVKRAQLIAMRLLSAKRMAAEWDAAFVELAGAR